MTDPRQNANTECPECGNSLTKGECLREECGWYPGSGEGEAVHFFGSTRAAAEAGVLMPALTSHHSEQLERAREMGSEHGEAAASWFFDGNTTEATYRRVLQGLEDGDPEILDMLPSGPLSGEWAGDPTPTSVLQELEADDDDSFSDDLLDAYCDAFMEASYLAIEKTARRALGAA